MKKVNLNLSISFTKEINVEDYYQITEQLLEVLVKAVNGGVNFFPENEDGIKIGTTKHILIEEEDGVFSEYTFKIKK